MTDIVGQFVTGCIIIETIAQTDNCVRIGRFDFGTKPINCRQRFIGGQQGPTPTGHAFGFTQMKIGDDQPATFGPEQRARRTRLQVLAVKVEII